MSSNMSLEDVMQELTKYGRPTVNQLSASASGGKAAGMWNVEVWVPSKWNKGAPEGVSVTGRRMIGQGSLREAAECCLARCQELAEGDLSHWYKFVSEEQAIREEQSHD